jgi:Ca-activated chloride channel family protein
MINFENANYLYFGFAIPVIIAAYLLNRRRQSKAKLKIGDKRLVDNLIIGARDPISFFKFALVLFAFIALIIALANPVSRIETNRVDATDTEIVFVVDASKSMLAADVAPSRLQQVQSFILQTVKQLNGEQVGMVLFAGKASPYLPFTKDYAYVASATKAISNNLVLMQGTSLKDALKISSLFFNSNDRNLKVLCILSDGESHSSGFEKVSDSLRKTGINLFAVGAGTARGAVLTEEKPGGSESPKKDRNGLPVISHLNEENLLRITGNNSRNYFSLSDKETAETAFVGNLKALEYKTPKKDWDVKGNFQLFLLIALILMILEVITTGYVSQKH